MKNYIYIFMFLGFIFTGCTKDESLITSMGSMSYKNDTLNTVALLEWHGDYAVDGCGFIIEIDEQEYKAINEEKIGEAFKSLFEPISVQIVYIQLNKKQSYHCGDLPYSLEYDVIEVLSIKRI